MFNGTYLPIDTVINELREYPFTESLNKRTASHYLVRAIGLMGAVLPLKRQYANVEIKEHKGVLPKNIMYIHGVNNKGNSCTNNGIPMIYSSDIYNSVLHSDEARKNCTGTAITTEEQVAQITKFVGEEGEMLLPTWRIGMSFTELFSSNAYSLNQMAIDTSFPTGWVEIAYDGIAVDDQGYPMIPNDETFKEAFKYYILKALAEPGFLSGTIQKYVYDEIQQKYYAYIGAAANNFNMPSPDQMQSLSNTLIRIIPDSQQYMDGWRKSNNPSRIQY